MYTFEQFIIAIYCEVDDALKFLTLTVFQPSLTGLVSRTPQSQ